jgi:hypothetical protein
MVEQINLLIKIIILQITDNLPPIVDVAEKKIIRDYIYLDANNNETLLQIMKALDIKHNKQWRDFEIKERQYIIDFKLDIGDSCYFFAECNEDNNINFVKFPIINISIDNLDIIENTPIYCINETQQYCIKINNNLIMGNIGNIYSKKNDAEKINKCKYTDCNNKFYGKECRYYHNNINRNFTNYSWNHINKNKDGKLDIKNKITKYDEDNSRFIGSLNTLMEDLPYSSTNEKDLRNSQLMHDILLFIVLSEYLIH